MWHKIILCLSLIATLQTGLATDWQKLTILDLKASYQYLQNDSAGGRDNENPHYHKWLKQGYEKALSRAKQVKNASSYNLVMNFYTNGFHDEHVQYVPYLQRFDFTQLWPGFTVYWQNHRFYVSRASHADNLKNLPPKGAQLLNCDQQSVTQLLLQRIFPYFGNPDLNASWHIVTPRLFFYSPNPWFSPLKYCTFLVNNQRKTYRLHWRKISNIHAYHLRMRANYAYQGKFSVTTFGKNNIWVSIPSFLPQTQKNIKYLRSIIQQAPTWHDKHIIVIDMRGNLGGNSLWGTRLLTALYGAPYYQQQTAKLATPIYQWRASYDNIAELQGFYSRYIQKNFGEKSHAYQQLQQTITGMQHALEHHYDYYPEKISPADLPSLSYTLNNPVKATLVFLTDGRCASSCLTFADQLFTFPHVIHAGQTTHASTNYTESVLVKLPSGAHLYYPMKVQRFRQRKSNQAYQPKKMYYYIGDINKTQNIKQWLMETVTNTN